ncbi:hypothetical protein ACYCEU_00485 [Actinotignum timonense]
MPSSGSGITVEEISHLVSEKKLKAWFGIVDKPKRLKEIGLGGVLVYINNKIADENLLASNQSAQMGGQYVTGEIYADYLNDRPEDPITSSRQGLDESDEEVELIMKLAKAMEGKAIAQWDAYKDKVAPERLPDRIKNNEKYREWERKLSPLQKTFNTKLLRIVDSFDDFKNDGDQWMSDREKVAFINSATTLVESLELLEIDNVIKVVESGDTDSLYQLVARYMGNVARWDTVQMAEAAAKRFNAIQHLQRLVDKDMEVEKAFEDCLFDNPWLLNPFWNRSTKSDEEIQVARQYFVKLRDKMGEKHKRRFIDIYVEVAEEELPIIVELKRSDGKGHSATSQLTEGNIIDQVNGYRKGIFSNLPPALQHRYTYKDIKALVILPKKVLASNSGPAGFTKEDFEEFEAKKIHLRTYEALLRDARRSYRDFFEAKHMGDSLPYFEFDSSEE